MESALDLPPKRSINPVHHIGRKLRYLPVERAVTVYLLKAVIFNLFTALIVYLLKAVIVYLLAAVIEMAHLLTAVIAASLAKAIRSAPTNPGVSCASRTKSNSGVNLKVLHSTRRILT